MKDIEIVVFKDKAWVRLKEYQKVKEENEQLQQKWLESEYEKSKLVSQIEKMKCCENCKHRYYENGINYCNNKCQEKLYNNWDLKDGRPQKTNVNGF